MSDSKQVPHRAGPLKQRNKLHKTGRHKTKGETSATNKGRVGLKQLTGQRRKEARKVDKKNKLKQLRANKRHEALLTKRSVGVEGSPPHLITVIPSQYGVDVRQVHTHLIGGCHGNHTSTVVCSDLKQRFTVLCPPSHDLYRLMDIARVADTLLIVYDLDSCTGEFDGQFLDCICSQGLPTTFHLAKGGEGMTRKALATARKAIQKTIQTRFPGEKLHLLTADQGPSSLLRTISRQKRHSVFSRDHHPHLVVERSEYISNPGEDNGTLKVSGYVRGKTLSVNGVVYVPNLGEFQLKQIDAPNDPRPLKLYGRGNNESCDIMEEGGTVLLTADPSLQQGGLVREVVPDPMEGEQTWPTEEDLQQASSSQTSQHEPAHRVPEGTSDYQAVWIVDSDGSEVDSGDEWEQPVLSPSDDDLSGDDSMSLAPSELGSMADPDKYDTNIDMDSEQKQLEQIRAAKEDELFPDELNTPQDVPARERFQKYRGLKSFRSSPWDKLENLPRDYARIFQFENFARSRKRVISGLADTDGAMPGWYVTLHMTDVPASYSESCDFSSSPMLVYGLLPHENKMSVVHFALKRTSNYTLPIKSKDPLVFHCGVRRFSASPIFSQHTAADKHKFERFFPGKGVCVASVYAPIAFPPQPVLVFSEQEDGGHVLVATGTVLGVDPGRVVCKRVALSGHPFKINKRAAVIRYMFFNREDILWFKPVELRTKFGRRGHIKEALGTHGHMKCVFDGQLKAQDTVLMNLYKRVFPKWTYSENITTPTGWSFGGSVDVCDDEEMT